MACRHCRAEAIPHPLPGQLSHDEGVRLIEAVRSFGDRPPILVFTGGDLLMRDRVHELLRYAHDLGLVVAASPSVTSLLTREALNRLRDAGASSLSISLDGLRETHDYIRAAPGCWDRTLEAIRAALAAGLHVQVNACVMQQNYRELPEVFSIIRRMGVPVWEVFYLVKTVGPHPWRNWTRIPVNRSPTSSTMHPCMVLGCGRWRPPSSGGSPYSARGACPLQGALFMRSSGPGWPASAAAPPRSLRSS